MATPGRDIAVVIPLYRAASYLPTLLQALEKQTFPLNRFEVVLVDDLSPDDTREVATRLRAESPLQIQLLCRETNGGVSAARNSGWRAARAGLILFIDQDCLAAPGLLTAHWQAHGASSKNALAVLGRIVWADYPENPASEHYKRGYFPAWETYNPTGPNFHLFITSNASVRVVGLQAVGGFDEPFRHNYEDIGLGYRLETLAGYRLTLAPDAVVYHNRPLPVPEMFRRDRVAGQEMVRLFKHYPALLGHSTLLNPAQSLDWAYRLSTVESLLADTLDRLGPAELEAHRPFLTEASRYLLAHPFLHRLDQPYLETLLAQRTYQRNLDHAHWLEGTYAQTIHTPQPKGLKARLGEINNRLKVRFFPKASSGSYPVQKGGKQPLSQTFISVSTLLTDETEIPYYVRLLAALEAQTFAPTRFELRVSAAADLITHLEKLSHPLPGFKISYWPLLSPEQAWPEAFFDGEGDWLVFLPVDALPAPNLLETYAHLPLDNTVWIGQELPLARVTLAQPETLPATTLPTEEEGQTLHYSAFRLNNVAIGRKLKASLPEGEGLSFGGGPGRDLAAVLVGWQLATEGGAVFRNCPAALSYASQTRRLAQSLQAYGEYPARLENIRRHYPAFAALYDRLPRPTPTKADLELLYNTLIEYALSQGMLQGLTEHFGLSTPAELASHPLFAVLHEQWEAERGKYLHAQRERVETGQKELLDYVNKLEESLSQLK